MTRCAPVFMFDSISTEHPTSGLSQRSAERKAMLSSSSIVTIGWSYESGRIQGWLDGVTLGLHIADAVVAVPDRPVGRTAPTVLV
jgi:hypothetical protein